VAVAAVTIIMVIKDSLAVLVEVVVVVALLLPIILD
jgi:hypothetical protein